MKSLKDIKKLNLSTDTPLRDFTSIKVGGSARYFIEADSLPALIECVRSCDTLKVAFRVLGGGSNLLISDGIIDTPIVKLTGNEFREIARVPEGVRIGASVSIREALAWMIKNEYAGLEFLAGIPATIGGALVMNASAFGASVSDYLLSVVAVDRKGNVRSLKKTEVRFSYRSSSLDEYVVTSAVFAFPSNDKKTLRSRIAEIIRHRMATQEIDARSAGCIFKNPAGERSAGFLIEQSGLKGMQYQGAYVSKKHANFIINRGNASYDDIALLIKTIKEKVHRDSGILLEEEVRRWTA